MGRIRKHRFLCILAAFALILAMIPIVQTQILGMELRRLPGAKQDAPPAVEGAAEPDAPVVGTRESAVYDYGYYPDDHWVEEKCGFHVQTGETGRITLELYYPFEYTGNETGHISIDGARAMDFALAGENTVIELQGKPNASNYVQIDSYFAKAPGGGDARELAFVLAGLEAR